MISIPNLKLAPGADEAALKTLAAKALKIPADDITGLRIRKKSWSDLAACAREKCARSRLREENS